MSNPLPYWEGPEVEGRLLNIRTLFIQSQIPPDMKVEGFSHIYIGMNMLPKMDWAKVRQWLEGGQIVTCEVTEALYKLVPPDVWNRVHILCKIPAPMLDKLKYSDTVSLCADSYHVFTATKHVLLEVRPEDYGFDAET